MLPLFALLPTLVLLLVAPLMWFFVAGADTVVGKPRDFLYSGSDESSEVGGSWRRWSAPGIERNGDGLKRRAAVTAADGDGSDACVQVRELRLSEKLEVVLFSIIEFLG